jgi:hypothetical protein
MLRNVLPAFTDVPCHKDLWGNGGIGLGPT